MKQSTLMVKGLTREQANALAGLFENGTVTNLLSKQLKKAGHHLDEQECNASVEYDDRPYNVNHEIFF